MNKLFIFLLFISFNGIAQKAPADTVELLENVIIHAYENNRKLIEVPAAISLVSNKDLNRYDNTTMVEALNTKPGVRMDERSPGSYRMNIRGSSLRSPFGVRNVKIYYNGIPFTDPGGSTYLNQMGFYNVQSVEIIKGPAGSSYGAGTGGVLLMNSNSKHFQPGVSLDYNTGSYGLQNAHINLRLGDSSIQNSIHYQHQESDGYRANTAMRRDVVSWDAQLKKSENSVISTHFLFGDLYYQTSGALTKAEYEANPQSARPKAGMSPSAQEAHAAFYSKTFLAGISVEQKLHADWKNTSAVYGVYSQNRNPNFRNFSRTSEPHFGGRTMFQWNKLLGNALFTMNTGAEFQQSFNTQRVYKNAGGAPGTLQTDDEIYNTQGFIFAQGNAEISGGWIITLGASLNESKMKFTRLSITSPQKEERDFKNEIAPRLAILKKVRKNLSVYGNIARGFSAPSTAELLPSTDVWNTDLQAESGMNYEVGSRGSLLRNKFYFDVNAYYYRLKNAIIQKRDASGGDYFDNAGSANQSGLEAFLSYELFNNTRQFFNYGNVYVSSTTNQFHYDVYSVGDKDYSGNKMPGIAAQTFAAGLDIKMTAGLYGNVTFFHSSRIALNDANTEFANPYSLLGLKIGYDISLSSKTGINLFAGGQNLLNETYSLGNDINAFGGRYYNAAPGRNFYVGVGIRFDR
ncbi:MAG: TonB-dependent receptor plug domain-containing protein [Ginsengibacter sp.]